MRASVRWTFALLLAAVVTARAQNTEPADPYANETKEERAARMAWWHEARFGMFIHWGVYAVPAGTYDGKQVAGIGEWIMNRGKIPVAVYREYAKQFTAAKYDADAWVRLAKKAGMKYIVITSKHHDGFTLFPSAATNWGIGRTPYGKDLLQPLADACRKNGIRLGFYYSQAQDWNNGGSACSGKWDPAMKRSMDEYIDSVAVPQVKEILTRYGDGIPAVLWWDTSCDMNKERADKLISLLKLKPGIIHNNRLGGGYKGDTETPEQSIPATGFKDRDWETCMTLNDTWGFKSYDNNWKSTETLVRNLIDIASKGGNYLLNVGPTAEGEIPAASIERLTEVGQWMDQYGAAIYGTTASPFSKLPWGRCTKKVGPDGGTLYLHVFQWPTDGKLLVPGLKCTVGKVRLLGGEKLKAESTDEGVVITVPAAAPNAIASVIELTFRGGLEVVRSVIHPAADGVLTLAPDLADLSGGLQVESKGSQPNIGFWTEAGDTARWTFKGAKPGTYAVSAEIAGTAPSAFTIECGGAKLEASTTAAGGYENFSKADLGRIALGDGEQTLVIKPAASRWNAINLRALTLTPQG